MQLSYTKEEKHCPYFGQYSPRDENKTSKFSGERRKNNLKTFSGAEANQLNHYVIPTLEEFYYDCAIIHTGMNDILRSKDMSELKDLPIKIMQIGTTRQRYNIGKVYVSSILPSTGTSFNIGQIKEVIKELCH